MSELNISRLGKLEVSSRLICKSVEHRDLSDIDVGDTVGEKTEKEAIAVLLCSTNTCLLLLLRPDDLGRRRLSTTSVLLMVTKNRMDCKFLVVPIHAVQSGSSTVQRLLRSCRTSRDSTRSQKQRLQLHDSGKQTTPRNGFQNCMVFLKALRFVERPST